MPRRFLLILGLLLLSACGDGEGKDFVQSPKACLASPDCGGSSYCSPRGWCIAALGCVEDQECGQDLVCSITGTCLQETLCLVDSDCPQVPHSMNCLEGRCDYAASCHADSDCAKGSFCDDSDRCRGLLIETRCQDDLDCRIPCTSDDQCVGETAVCNLPAGFCSNSQAFYCGADGTCLFGAACTWSAQCPPGQSCSPAGYCGANFCFSTPCQTGFRCATDGACYLESWACTTDDSCPVGQQCNADARCRPDTCQEDLDCGVGGACTDLGCQTGTCEGDGDCLGGMICQTGSCGWRPCDGGRNCPKGLNCGVDGNCRPVVACLGNQDCGLVESCMDGACVELRVCQTNNDCRQGSHCSKDGFCIQGN
jgi:hypothetical protein